MKMESDKISNLPGDAIKQILTHLPIREAVRTSVLSSIWRYRWALLPHLVFDDQCVSNQNHKTCAQINTEFLDIVDHALLLHIGPLHTFKLSYQEFLAANDIDRWILHLLRKSIKEFILQKWDGPQYKISSWLFSCQDLVRLELHNCLLKPPLTFKGFRSLKSLDIQNVTLTQDVFESMTFCCPLLESLTLCNVDGFTTLKIGPRNLKYLEFRGSFADVNLETNLNLIDVSIDLDFYLWDVPGDSINLLKFLVHLPRLQNLAIKSFFLKYLSVGALQGKLPRPCLDLTSLSISICFNDPEEILTALCLIRSSPALQELKISGACRGDLSLLFGLEDIAVLGEVENSWLDDNCKNCSFTQLRLVEVTGVSGVKAEVDFIRLLLLTSPVLERMTLQPASANWVFESLRELVEIRTRHASVHAVIIPLDTN